MKIKQDILNWNIRQMYCCSAMPLLSFLISITLIINTTVSSSTHCETIILSFSHPKRRHKRSWNKPRHSYEKKPKHSDIENAFMVMHDYLKWQTCAHLIGNIKEQNNFPRALLGSEVGDFFLNAVFFIGGLYRTEKIEVPSYARISCAF